MMNSVSPSSPFLLAFPGMGESVVACVIVSLLPVGKMRHLTMGISVDGGGPCGARE